MRAEQEKMRAEDLEALLQRYRERFWRFARINLDIDLLSRWVELNIR
jgi:hypothetical protein